MATTTFIVGANPAHDGARPFPLVNYTDHWWAQEESGWGIFVVQHPSDRIFAGWFVYDSAGRTVWYNLQPGSWTKSDTYTGPVYKSTGPHFGGPFYPSQVVRTVVGAATLTFQDSGNATFSYTVEGVSDVKRITRLPF